MATSQNTANLISQLKKLDKEDQLNVFQQFKLILKKAVDNNSTSIRLTSLSGLGSEIWKDTVIEIYVNEERQW